MRCLLVFVFVSLSTLSAATVGDKIIKFNMSQDGYPPYMILGDKPGGIMFDVLDVIAKKKGYTIKIFNIPRKRVQIMLQTGEIDASPRAVEWTKNPFVFLFTEPVVASRDVIVSSSKKPLKFESIEDLFGKNLRTRLGYKYPELEPHFSSKKITRLDDLHEFEVLRKIRTVPLRFDGGIINELVARWIIKENNWKNEFTFSDKDVGNFGYRIMFSSKWYFFIKDFNAELHKMKQQGMIQAIVEKYR